MDRNIENVKDRMCVVTAMDHPIETFEEDNMPKCLDEEEAKSILNKKRLNLGIKKYRIKEEKIKENMNKIYGILFVQCTPSLQSVLKIVPDYENKSKYCNCL